MKKRFAIAALGLLFPALSGCVYEPVPVAPPPPPAAVYYAPGYYAAPVYPAYGYYGYGGPRVNLNFGGYGGRWR